MHTACRHFRNQMWEGKEGQRDVAKRDGGQGIHRKFKNKKHASATISAVSFAVQQPTTYTIFHREKFKVTNKKLDKKGGTSNKDKARQKHTILVRNKDSIVKKRKLASKQKRSNKKQRLGAAAKFKMRHG